MSASKSKTSYLAVKYRRILARRGKPRVIVAIEHTILVAIWNMLTTGEAFNDLGHDYQTGQNPETTLNKALKIPPRPRIPGGTHPSHRSLGHPIFQGDAASFLGRSSGNVNHVP